MNLFKFIIFFNLIAVTPAFSIPDDCSNLKQKSRIIQDLFSYVNRSLNRISDSIRGYSLGQKFETGAKEAILPEWGPQKIKTTPMLEKFVGENKPEVAKKIFRLKVEKAVKYFTQEEARAYELHFGTDGLLYDNQGKLFDTQDAFELDKSGIKRTNGLSRDGYAILVMDKRGRIFAHKRPQIGLIHHSSLISGEESGFAGEIKVIKGEIVEITNFSGHYLPEEDDIEQMFDRIGIVLNSDQIKKIKKTLKLNR